MRYLTTITLIFGLLIGSASAQEKSPKTAFFLSLLVPGLGELYSGAKWRAVGFMASEGFTWLAYFSWRGKGNDLKADFRAYADQHWSESRYRAWQAYNRSQPQSEQYYETETLPDKVNGDTQQYYELIGKYPQFIFGWDDVPLPFSSNNQDLESPRQLDYEDQRNESNKYLKRASVITGLAVLNRIASAIHASAYVRSNNASSGSSVWLDLTPIDWQGRSVIELKKSF